MCTEKVKGPSRREAKLLKWLRRNRKLCFHSCSQVHERFLCPQVEETPWWRRQYEASCEEEDGGLHLVHTLTLSLNNRGFPFFLWSQVVLKMPPHPRPWEPNCVCWHHFPHSQGGSDGWTTAPAWATLRQRPALDHSGLTATSNTHQPHNRELWWSLQGTGLQQETKW